jgi:hypothetical protein
LTTKKPAPSIAASVGELLPWSSPCWSIRYEVLARAPPGL